MQNELTDDMVQQLLNLPYDQRGKLADTLINSLHPAGDRITADEWKTAWTEECHRRMGDMDSGEVKMVSADELIARLRAKRDD